DAWRFRNYVIDAFNKDKPFHQFVREQIAGDLLPSPDQKKRDEQITATGFLVLGPKVIGDNDKEQLRMDVVDEQIDTVGKAFLGLSLGCARCHDHKFDPVPTKDYYAMAGIFGSTETVHGQLLHRRDLSGWNLRPLGENGEKLYREWLAYDEKLDVLKKEREKSQTRLVDLKKKIGTATNDVKETPLAASTAAKQPPAANLQATQEEISKLEETLKSLTADINQLSSNSPPKPPLAMAVSDREVIADARICVRGEIHRPGESFDSPGRSEPDLASPLRCGTGAYSGRFRPAGRTAIASGIARLSRGPIHGNELVVQTDDSRDCLEPRLSDEFGTS